MTLTEFLLARIAEGEAEAAEVQSHVDRWKREAALNGADGTQASIVLATMEGSACDPARVLAECEAKRRIVEMHTDHDCDVCTNDDETLALLAQPYADHPDFQQEWAV